jgi:hypothetical protein
MKQSSDEESECSLMLTVQGQPSVCIARERFINFGSLESCGVITFIRELLFFYLYFVFHVYTVSKCKSDVYSTVCMKTINVS